MGLRPTAAVAQNLLRVLTLFSHDLVDCRELDSGAAAETMTRPTRQYHQIAGRQSNGLRFAGRMEPAFASFDDMKVRPLRREGNAPRRGKFATAENLALQLQ
jgi:hypothetical protein